MSKSFRPWQVFSQAPGLIAVLEGRDHRFEFVNREFEIAFGLQGPQGRLVTDVFSAVEAHRLLKQLERVWATGRRCISENMPFLLRTTGDTSSRRYVDFVFQPLVDEQGQMDGVFVQGQDTTQHRLMQASAHAIHERYATLLASMSEGMVMLGTDFKVLQINDAAQKLDGRKTRDIVGLTLWELWPSATSDALRQAHQEAMASQMPRHVEHHFISCSQQVLWLDIRIYPVPRGLAVLARDITSFKIAATALHESEERFKAAVSAVGVMWTNNTRGEMRGDQPGWTQITGQTEQEYSGLGWVRALHPDDQAATLSAWQEAVKRKSDFSIEHRLRTRQSTWRRYAVRAAPVLGTDGQVREWVGVHVDVTEARALSETLRSAARRKDKFLAILAHELRNPLAPIRSAAHALSQGQLKTDEVTRGMDIISRQVQHMARLLDDVLDVSRISAGRLNLKKSFHALRGVVNTAVETARPVLDAKAHRLCIELPEPDVDVEVDDLRLAQVLANLLVNAARYSSHGRRIWLTADASDHELVIEVRDEGIGIRTDQLDNVFEMFAQLSASAFDSREGLGIGLALSRGLIELHGGRLDVASEGMNQGSSFTIRLPTSVVLSQSQPLQVVEQPASPAPAPANLSVLIADDNADAAQSLGLLLSLDGHEIRLATDGVSALRLAQEAQPEVAVLDIGMPDMDGHALAGELRRRPGGQDMLIIAVTGWGQKGDQHRALAAGFDRHFTKPVDPQALLSYLAQWSVQRPRCRT